jgi:hypothetical protein
MMEDILEYDIDKTFSALDDSVNLINSETEKENDSDEINNRVWANWKHIEIMLEKDFVKESGRDLSLYVSAVEKGSDFSPNRSE